MLIKQKQTTLSIEKQKELVNLVLDHYRKDVDLADLTKGKVQFKKINEKWRYLTSQDMCTVAGSAGELAALGNIVLRGSKYGAPVALELYRAAMDAGDDRGAFSFANMVYRGYRGTEKNEDLGVRILSELARKGHPYAQMNLASILMRTQADQVPAAIKLYELAARSIDSAYVELGRMYRIGYGVHQDHTKAMQYFEKGAQKGNAQCNFMLGVYYSTPGKVVDLDQTKAFKYFQKAAMRGLPEAQYNVGLRFLKGHGVETNPYNAAEFFRMAAMQGFQLAQANLANMYLQGHGVKKDMDEGRTWLSKAAERGGSIGEECKKRLNELDGIPQDKPRCNIM